LEDVNLKPLTLRLEKKVPIYYQVSLDRLLGALVAPRDILLEGLSPEAFRVRGMAAHGEVVVGWVRKADMPLEPELLENLRKLWERQKVVNEMVESHQVALGMTGSEVKASLGEPTRKNSRLDGAGREEILEYVVFDRVPQVQTLRDVYGRLYQEVYYIKVETGSLKITLKDDTVTSIEEAKGNPLGNGGVKIVPPPINIF
jgi:hypothetical protein